MPLPVKQVFYETFGDPEKVLSIQETTIHPENLGPTEVLVRWLAAPVNPADLAQIAGAYGIRPSLPAVPGIEGCGVVEKVGSKVTNQKVGDNIIPLEGVGTWRTHGIHDSAQLFAFGKGLPTSTVATMLVNPPTAYRLLKNFVELKKGDVVVQNGANSAVGKYVIQLAHLWGVKTINVVRNRPDIEQLKVELKKYGADEIYTEEEASSGFSGLSFKQALPEIQGARLALDCVGGEASLLVSSTLGPGGALVNYGAMSGKPLQVSPTALIFKNVKVHGFWITSWYSHAEQEARTKMFTELAMLFKEGKLKTPLHVEHRLEEFAKAVNATRSSANSKQILIPSKL
ncbi:oxidoreductasezinc-binding dehydrogenase family protein [Aphelenchoides avenae]|nr:oxidoreductasezinc-binding dehydrogenase family protein [Aphelenchus avenae]